MAGGRHPSSRRGAGFRSASDASAERGILLISPHLSARITAGERLDPTDALALHDGDDLLGLGRLAGDAARKRHGARVSFHLIRRLTVSNICVHAEACGLCAFAAGVGDLEGFTLSRDEITAGAAVAAAAEPAEIRIATGIHPAQDYDWYLGIVRALARAHPGLRIEAWSAVEIDHFARLTGRPVGEVLREMSDAGIAGLSGGGAVSPHGTEAPAWRDRWLAIHEAAHGLGLPSTAMLPLGRGESGAERIDFLSRLRDLQDRTGGFLALTLQVAPRPGEAPDAEAVALEELRALAVARLFLDNFDAIGASWRDPAGRNDRIALHFGANDLLCDVDAVGRGGVAGSADDAVPPRERALHLIRSAGRVPVERDALFREVRVWR